MKRRTETFLGIHFDYHAQTDTQVGEFFNEELVDEFLREVKPDFMQVDSKGHPGVASFPTPYGTHAHIIKDVMPLWRKYTKKYDVALLAHYSGVQDDQAIINHPEWAVVNEDGSKDVRATSVFSDYKDKRLIPELKLLAKEYGFNGAWVDGECWGTKIDYSDGAKKAYKEKYGVEPDFKNNFRHYLDFCRESYWEYLKYYITELRKELPEFDVTSNWALSSESPTAREDLPLTFLSGDLPVRNAVDAARYESRMLEQNKKPWDLMAWGFSLDFEFHTHLQKTAKQICQELSEVMAMGGGVQTYFFQSPYRGITHRDVLERAKEIAKFCRAREPFCHKKQLKKETLVLFSEKQYYDERLDCPFHNFTPRYYDIDLRYLINALLDCNYHVTNSIIERNEDLTPYKTVILSEVDSLTDEQKQRLIAYAEQGGNLVIMGAKSTQIFKDEFNLKVKSCEEQYFAVEHDDKFACLNTQVCVYEDSPYTIQKGYLSRFDYYELYYKNQYFPAGLEKTVGKGRIALVPFAVGRTYNVVKDRNLKEFIRRAVKVAPTVRIENSSFVDVVIAEEQNKTFINLVNLNGGHCHTKPMIYDDITPINNLVVTFESAKKPSKITMQPENKEIEFTYKDGKVTCVVDSLEIHTVLVVE